MQYWINIARFTFIEVLQGRIFQILLLSTLAAPLFGLALSALFMIDLGKVYMDAVMAVVHFTSSIYILFIASSVLARDIEQKVCYFLVVIPATRESYIFGRFMGFIFAYMLLTTLLSVESSLVGVYVFSQKAMAYASGFTWFHLSLLILLHAFQYIAVLGFVFFIVSWATGLPEIIFFSTVGLILSWIFPQVLLVAAQMGQSGDSPIFLYQIFTFLYALLPHLNGANISLALTHGLDLPFKSVFLYVLEHMSYAGVLLGLAVWRFQKRDL